MHLTIEVGVVAEMRQNIKIETIAMSHIIAGTTQALAHELERDSSPARERDKA